VSSLAIITTFQEKKREKRLQYEKRLLRELSLKELQEDMKRYFSTYVHPSYVYYMVIEDGCIDVAIEAYLLGASYSRFGYFGESVKEARNRCYQSEKGYIDYLFDFMHTWLTSSNSFHEESLYFTCEQYVQYWWEKGFQEGLKKFRLRMH
jgi:hypothetical protein